jgi:hypothetical protein
MPIWGSTIHEANRCGELFSLVPISLESRVRPRSIQANWFFVGHERAEKWLTTTANEGMLLWQRRLGLKMDLLHLASQITC